MGNCYSLQKDHETALKNFQRAVQLNPRFAYAHTLCGHEYALCPLCHFMELAVEIFVNTVDFWSFHSSYLFLIVKSYF